MKALIKQLVPSTIIRYRYGTTHNKIALTFDDGPKPGTTNRILETLARYNMTATFFVLGEMAEAGTELCRDIISLGHEIGNHGYSHKKFTELSNKAISVELDKTNRIVENITGYKPTMIRPPNGAISVRVLWYLISRQKQPATMWSQSIDNEWKKTSNELLNEFRELRVQRGDIILLHDVNDGTVAALPGILDYLLENGLQGSSISNLVG